MSIVNRKKGTKSTKSTKSTNRKTQKKRPMSKYVVAIPSYNRSESIVQKSLTTLIDGGVPKHAIHIFVANKEEEKKYKKGVPKNMYGKIVVGKLGITEQRKFIIKHYPENQAIVSIDDDVEGLFRKKTDKELTKIKNVHAFFNDAFMTLKNEKLKIWGIYPVHNPFFMKKTTTTDLKFIIGTLYGFINRKTTAIQPSSKIKEKEDYEQSIKYFIKDGGVVRFNDITIKAKKHAPGGLGVTEGRLTANRVASKYLEKNYPGYVSIFHRDNGMTEVRMSRIKRDETPY
tara:strand:+ start:107 stop:964 length:858 start_codon:yes stop_codon:yes gene_type:complete